MAFSLEFAYGKLKRWNQEIIRALTHPPLSLFAVHFPVFFHYPAVQPETTSLRIEDHASAEESVLSMCERACRNVDVLSVVRSFDENYLNCLCV